MLELKFINFECSDLDLLIVPVCKDTRIHSNSVISHLVETVKTLTGFRAKKGELVTLFCPSGTAIKRVVFLGLGNSKEVDLQALRLFAGKAVNHCIDLNLIDMTCAVPSVDFGVTTEDLFSSLMEGIFLANHIFDDYKREKSRTSLTKVALAVSDVGQLDFSYLVPKIKAVCNGTILARQWVNIPSNDKKPKQFAKLLYYHAKDTSIKVSIFDDRWLLEKKFKAMLTVGQGSSNKPRLVVMEYKPVDFKRTILLVGKGVTFDSGGINLKPNTGIEGMKTDMAGAAAVGAALLAMSDLNESDSRVVGIIPLVENMPSGNAMRPGDIIRTFLGKTVEIGNTDAEGRLILADALAWGIKEYKPDIVIDIATLTGACAIALGDKIAGVFSTDDHLSKLIVKAGENVFERCWPMPIPDEYRDLLKSDLADLNNISSSKLGGAITAAAFLSEFVSEVPWAHIDIAGPARTNKKTDYCARGATGFGVRLLCELIRIL